MKKFRLLLVGVLTLFALTACSSGSSDRGYHSSIFSGYDMAYTESNSVMKNYGYTSSSDSAYATEEIESKIIVNSNIYMETKNFTESTTALERLVSEVGGYIQDSNVYTSSGSLDTTGYRNADYTLRIPSERYNEFMTGAGEIGNITSVRTSTDDVTTSYYDTQTRIDNLKAQEERLVAMYEKAETIEEIITLESRISNLRYEIESNELKIRNWDLLTKYSTVTIDVTEVKDLTVETVGYFDELFMSFSESGSMFVELLQEITLFFARYSTFILTGVVIALFVNLNAKRSREKYIARINERKKELNNRENNDQ